MRVDFKGPCIGPWAYMKISARFGGYIRAGYIRDLFCMCPNVLKHRSFIAEGYSDVFDDKKGAI